MQDAIGLNEPPKGQGVTFDYFIEKLDLLLGKGHRMEYYEEDTELKIYRFDNTVEFSCKVTEPQTLFDYIEYVLRSFK